MCTCIICDEKKGEKLMGGATAANGKREVLHLHHHRRSRSASDRNFTVSKGALHSQNDTQGSPSSTSGSMGHSPLHETSSCSNKNMSSNHRTSLEKDIELLQVRLQQEKSMRTVLERAMGRASSTLSPGHRHFAAQTKELIAEIHLLEEEVADREQHVLSLYRSIFENCVSRPPSEANSGITSPAHAKHETRKHPSIISSAFCSSKKFPLRPLQAFSSINESRKRTSNADHAPLSSGKGHADFSRTSSDAAKLREKYQVTEKNSALRSLKDHLHHCPSKLSEEMVRWMAAVYCWLHNASSKDSEKKRSPLLPRSSTNVAQLRRGVGEDQGAGPVKSTMEISWISTDKNEFSHVSFAMNKYRVLVEQLDKVDVRKMEINAQTAFWINLYNALIMHAYLAYGIPHNSLRRLALFHKAAYKIGGHVISANAIEQSIFCFKTTRVGWWLETIISTALRKKTAEERQLVSSKLGLPDLQPALCFTLCTGATSDPRLNVYTASNVEQELQMAKKEFLQENIVLKKSGKVFLPKSLERLAREASMNLDHLLKWIIENIDDKKLIDSIQKCIDRKSKNKKSHIIEWLPYNSRFRYVFSKDLAEMRWLA